ncbi:hypothetical protein EW146_g5176 [Bondarzewia mesenterica]|uniref:Integrase catalytic domain-containing protein n=1 Tax=Bondarzewia mesenterica TaxID=1095465 RepID=A0A4S4LSA4_9AGAM|nr:hypothetical protein EW146_g5176 [Bondarzewia mesenterica]
MCAALCKYIRKICHVYLDDIIIWSQTVEEHITNVSLVLQALRDAHLYCSPKKTSLFCDRVNFLGHVIFADGIEADPSKIDRILDWPVSTRAMDVRAFLGLVRYISSFLPQLAKHTHILTLLTTLDAEKQWPGWSPNDQLAFDAIKQLVISCECLTTIDHDNPRPNKIFVTCDTSNCPDNTVADALFCLPPDSSVSALASLSSDFSTIPISNPTSHLSLLAAILSVHSDAAFLNSILDSYQIDPWCQKLLQNLTSFPNARLDHDGLLFIGSHLPGMQKDIEQGYIPACLDCQHNKSLIHCPFRPLHPLPVPDDRCQSIAIDFIGPLPLDHEFDCIITFTDRAGSNIRLIPTTSDITAEHFTALFFEHWFCNNGLPDNIVSDQDKLFTSSFWTTFNCLCGVHLKLSSLYHPQTDGASECTNKSIIQALYFHVNRQQKGWVRTLPLVHFYLMNTINASTDFSPFQLYTGRSPRLLPPLSSSSSLQPPDNNPTAHAILAQLHATSRDALDNLLASKVTQAHHSNRSRALDLHFKVSDHILLSTFHQHREYTNPDEHRIAKFMLHYNELYIVTSANSTKSTYTLNLPNSPQSFLTFHSSLLCPFYLNNDTSYPSHTLHCLPPILSENGQEE